jgi:hypothetical protein
MGSYLCLNGCILLDRWVLQKLTDVEPGRLRGFKKLLVPQLQLTLQRAYPLVLIFDLILQTINMVLEFLAFLLEFIEYFHVLIFDFSLHRATYSLFGEDFVDLKA